MAGAQARHENILSQAMLAKSKANAILGGLLPTPMGARNNKGQETGEDFEADRALDEELEVEVSMLMNQLRGRARPTCPPSNKHEAAHQFLGENQRPAEELALTYHADILERLKQAAPTTGFESTYVANQHLMKRLTEMVQKEQQKQAQQAAANGGRRRGILPVQADDPELEAALQQVMPVLGPLSQYNQQELAMRPSLTGSVADSDLDDWGEEGSLANGAAPAARGGRRGRRGAPQKRPSDGVGCLVVPRAGRRSSLVVASAAAAEVDAKLSRLGMPMIMPHLSSTVPAAPADGLPAAGASARSPPAAGTGLLAPRSSEPIPASYGGPGPGSDAAKQRRGKAGGADDALSVIHSAAVAAANMAGLPTQIVVTTPDPLNLSTLPSPSTHQAMGSPPWSGPTSHELSPHGGSTGGAPRAETPTRGSPARRHSQQQPLLTGPPAGRRHHSGVFAGDRSGLSNDYIPGLLPDDLQQQRGGGTPLGVGIKPGSAQGVGGRQTPDGSRPPRQTPAPPHPFAAMGALPAKQPGPQGVISSTRPGLVIPAPAVSTSTPSTPTAALGRPKVAVGVPGSLVRQPGSGPILPSDLPPLSSGGGSSASPGPRARGSPGGGSSQQHSGPLHGSGGGAQGAGLPHRHSVEARAYPSHSVGSSGGPPSLLHQAILSSLRPAAGSTSASGSGGGDDHSLPPALSSAIKPAASPLMRTTSDGTGLQGYKW